MTPKFPDFLCTETSFDPNKHAVNKWIEWSLWFAFLSYTFFFLSYCTRIITKSLIVLFVYLFIYYSGDFDRQIVTLVVTLLYVSLVVKQGNAMLPTATLFSFRKSLYVFSLGKRWHSFCVTFFFVQVHLLIFVLLYFHAGCWMAMYCVYAASQDWLIQALVRGRIENLTILQFASRFFEKIQS